MRLQILLKIYFLIISTFFTHSLIAENLQKKLHYIDEINIHFSNFKNFNYKNINSLIKIKPGQYYDLKSIHESIKNLYNTNQFDLVSFELKNIQKNKKKLIISITSRYLIKKITFEGVTKIQENFLREQIKPNLNHYLNHSKFKLDVLDKIKLYNIDINIHPEFNFNEKKGEVHINLKINLEPKLSFSKVIFNNIGDIREEKLHKLLNYNYNIPFFNIKKMDFNIVEFENNLQIIKDYCINQGYLDTQISNFDISFKKLNLKNLKIIYINLNLKKRYFIGELKISNNEFFNQDKIINFLDLPKHQCFSLKKINKGINTIKSQYHKYGYIDAYITPYYHLNDRTNIININFKINEGKKIYLDSYLIKGNKKTDNKVILREFEVFPGDYINLELIKNNVQRLQKKTYFDEIKFIPIKNNKNFNKRKLKIFVKEAKTASMNFGIGLNSVEKFTGFVEFFENNFDLFNYYNWFQGSGQKLRIRLNFGFKSNNFLILFEEPWFFNKKISSGLKLFGNSTLNQNLNHHEIRKGFEVFFNKDINKYFQAKAFYNIENINIFNINKEFSSKIFAGKELRSISKIGITILYDTKNNNDMYSTNENHIEIGSEVASEFLGGQTNYIKAFASFYKKFSIFQKYTNQNIEIFLRTGTIFSYKKDFVPSFERYYMGGYNNLRGFSYKKGGIMDKNGKPIGGKTMLYSSIQYIFNINHSLKTSLFYDIGYLNKKELNWNPNNYKHNIGLGIELLCFGSPLHIDLAFPIEKNKQKTFNNPELNFYFGRRF